MRRTVDMFPMAALLALGSGLAMPGRNDFDGMPDLPSPKPKARLGYCTCGKRISDNKASSLACKQETAK